MSSQKGNVQKSGPPKHKNRMVFKNNLHDTNKRTQAIRELTIAGVCARCKDIVDWKIKYKKYKPLTQAKKCVKCGEKRVKKAYYVVCEPCTKTHNICAKCAKPGEIVVQPGLTLAEEAREQSELDYQLQQLPERKRRTFYRSLKSKKGKGDGEEADEQEGSEQENSDSEDSAGESADEVNTEEKTENVSNKMKDLELSPQLNNDSKDSGSSGVVEDKIVDVVRKIDEEPLVEDHELLAQSVSDTASEIPQSTDNSAPEPLIDNASETSDDQINSSTQNPNDACMSSSACVCITDSETTVSCECSHSCEQCQKTCEKSLVVEKLL